MWVTVSLGKQSKYVLLFLRFNFFGFQGEDLLKKRGLETYPTQLIGGEGHLHLTENFQIAFLLIAPESGKEMADEDQMIGDFFLTHVMISRGISLIAYSVRLVIVTSARNLGRWPTLHFAFVVSFLFLLLFNQTVTLS